MEYIRLDELVSQDNNVVKLDDLEDLTKSKKKLNFVNKFFIEIGKFIFILVLVFIFSVIFINLNTFLDIFGFSVDKSYASDLSKLLKQSLSSQSSGDENLVIGDDFIYPDNQEYLDILNQKLDGLSVDTQEQNIYQEDMGDYLEKKSKKYSFNFNLLPPDNRIILTDIGIDAPIIDVYYMDIDKLEKADFDAELYKGVVRYPNTTQPGGSGNVLIFGHTSYYWWKKNPYGNVFAKIPSLDTGNKIKIVWDGKLHEYEVFEKIVKSPSQVPDEINSYTGDNYLFLMGCYPIGTDKNRILVVAREVKPQVNNKLSLKQK